MATDKFTYDMYHNNVQGKHGDPWDVWTVWHVDVKLRATGERVYRTIQYVSMDDAVDAALDWIDDNMDNEDIG